MPKAVTKAQLKNLKKRVDDLLKDPLFEKTLYHAHKIEVAYDAAQEMYARIQALVLDADTAGVISGSELKAHGNWDSEMPEIKETTDITHIRVYFESVVRHVGNAVHRDLKILWRRENPPKQSDTVKPIPQKMFYGGWQGAVPVSEAA